MEYINWPQVWYQILRNERRKFFFPFLFHTVPPWVTTTTRLFSMATYCDQLRRLSHYGTCKWRLRSVADGLGASEWSRWITFWYVLFQCSYCNITNLSSSNIRYHWHRPGTRTFSLCQQLDCPTCPTVSTTSSNPL